MKRLVLYLSAVLLLTGCRQKAAFRWQKQYDLGMQYLEEENCQEAILAFSKAIEINYRQPEAYEARGGAYILSGETKEHLSAAQADYERAIELGENSVQAYMGLADAYIRQRKYEEALEILYQGLEDNANDKKIADKIEQMESGKITDALGRARKTSYYNAEKEFIGYSEWYYNETGFMEAVATYSGDGIRTGYGEILYDKQGNQVQDWGIVMSTPVTLGGKLLYEYDGDGNCIKESYYDLDEILKTYLIMEYNEEGKEIRRSSYGPGGDLWGYSINEFDSEGNCTRIEYYDSDGTLNSYDVFEFDKDGDSIIQIQYDADGTIKRSILSDGPLVH